ncbi:MAG: hypothetical protein WBF90_08955 [Rivularia sp. (in: cyanobacteria)]|jgi:hypothetical protein
MQAQTMITFANAVLLIASTSLPGFSYPKHKQVIFDYYECVKDIHNEKIIDDCSIITDVFDFDVYQKINLTDNIA